MSRDLEAAWFNRFANAYPIPEGRTDHTDRPDFRIHTVTRGVLGIEVTGLYKESGEKGRQANESERDLLLEAARQRCITAGVPPLNVFVIFAPYVRLGKANRTAFATKLASLIEARMPPKNDDYVRLENYSRDPAIPEWLLSVNIARLPVLRQHHWYTPAGGWVQTDCIDLIQSRLDKKAKAYLEYRKQCDECWLLLVASGFRPSSLFEPSPETLSHQYLTPFQKVFLMEQFSGSVKELSASAAPRVLSVHPTC